MTPALDTDRRSPREAALIADVLHALNGQLHDAEQDADQQTGRATPDEVQRLISAAVSEMNRVAPAFMRGGIAPVLGVGVLQSLIRQRHAASVAPSMDAGDGLDERR